MKKLRVLFVTTSFPVQPNWNSGPFVKKLADSLSKQAELTVITPSHKNAAKTNTRYPVILSRYAPSRQETLAHCPGGIPAALASQPLLGLYLPALFISMVLSTLKTARKSDLLHGNWGIGGLILLPAKFIFKKKLITTLRGEDVNRAKTSLTFRWQIFLAIKYSDAIVTVNQLFKAELSLLFPKYEPKFHCIYNGIDIPKTTKPHRKNEILFVGSLIPRKAPLLLLNAFIETHSPNWKLVFIGDGALSKNIQDEILKKGLSNHIELAGSLSSEEVTIRMQSATILVLPSLHEGRANVLLEAMANRLAIVCSNIPENTEVIQNNIDGLHFDSGSPTDLKHKLEELMSNKVLLGELQENAFNRIVSNDNNWKKCAENYLNLYKQNLCK